MKLKTYIKNRFRVLTNLVYCVGRGFPLRAGLFCDIDFKNIPVTCRISHPFGIVIRPDAQIGEYCIFRNGVTIGVRRSGVKDDPAIIGHNVDFGANSIVLGSVTIGDGARIGAGAIVLKDVPSDTTITGIWK